MCSEAVKCWGHSAPHVLPLGSEQGVRGANTAAFAHVAISSFLLHCTKSGGWTGVFQVLEKPSSNAK